MLYIGQGELYYIIIYSPRRSPTILVLTFYSRSGSKGSNHGWKETSTNIGEVSYLLVKLFTLFHLVEFQANRYSPRSSQTRNLLSFLYAHISSDAFLCVLPGNHELSADNRSLYVTDEAYKTFSLYTQPHVLHRVITAVKALKGARRKTKKTKSDERGESPVSEDE